MKIATFKHQRHQSPPGESARLAARGGAGRRLPAGAQGERRELSESGRPRCRLWRGLARTEDLERDRDPRQGCRAHPDPGRAARRPRGRAGPLHRSGRERGARRLHLFAERQPAAGAEVRLQARLVRPADRPVRPSSTQPACRPCSPATTTSSPTDLDIYPTKSWANDALLQPESRAAFRRLLDQGWTDAIRILHPAEPMYTFWDYKRDRWRRNAGLRLDHLLLSPPLVSRLVEAGIDRDVRGQVGASDHAPAWIVLRR
jgi:hypothetical protein